VNIKDRVYTLKDCDGDREMYLYRNDRPVQCPLSFSENNRDNRCGEWCPAFQILKETGVGFSERYPKSINVKLTCFAQETIYKISY
jgi:hypothetical protein